MLKRIFNYKEDKVVNECQKVIKKKCGELVANFIEKYGCRKCYFCKGCGITAPTLKRLLQGDENLKIDYYIAALYFIGMKYTEALRMI